MLEGIGLANKSLDSAPADESEISAEHPSVCFELGIRYGKCATLSMFGQACDTNDDIVMPLDCRGKAETKNGVRTGVRAAYKDMGLPAK
jgi:hypothetical protein